VDGIIAVSSFPSVLYKRSHTRSGIVHLHAGGTLALLA
jgi:hypothetical protein